MSTFAVGSIFPLKPRAHTSWEPKPRAHKNRKSKGIKLGWRIYVSHGFRLGRPSRSRQPGRGGWRAAAHLLRETGSGWLEKWRSTEERAKGKRGRRLTSTEWRRKRPWSPESPPHRVDGGAPACYSKRSREKMGWWRTLLGLRAANSFFFFL